MWNLFVPTIPTATVSCSDRMLLPRRLRECICCWYTIVTNTVVTPVLDHNLEQGKNTYCCPRSKRMTEDSTSRCVCRIFPHFDHRNYQFIESQLFVVNKAPRFYKSLFVTESSIYYFQHEIWTKVDLSQTLSVWWIIAVGRWNRTLCNDGCVFRLPKAR